MSTPVHTNPHRPAGQRNSLRRKISLPEEWWWEVDGYAGLCFNSDCSSFEGYLITKQEDYFCLQGKSSGASGDDDTIVDVDLIEIESAHVQHLQSVTLKTTIHGCELKSENIDFKPDKLMTGAKAELFIKRNFSHKMTLRHCQVCTGPMHITIKRSKAEERCSFPAQYIL